MSDSEDSFVEKINNEVVLSERSTIVSGRNNCIRTSFDSSIIGGRSSFIRNSNNSVIVGSCDSYIGGDSENTVILGGCGLTAFGCINTTITQRLQKVKKIRFFTNATPSPLEDGMIWYESNKLWGRINGQTGTFSLVT
jgi:hypothetical protein